MINDETQEQVDSSQEETTEEVDTEVDTDETAEAEPSTDWEAEAKKWKAIAERTKRKATKEGKRSDLHTPDAPTAESVDERILRREGFDEELMKELKRVARFNEQDLLTASTDPMFVSIKERITKERQDKEAALGASKGSGAGKPRKDFTTPGLTTEDHKALWKKKMGL